MKLPQRKDRRSMLEKEISRLEHELSETKVDDKRYGELQDKLAKLYEIQTRMIEVKMSTAKRLDPNTLLVVGGGIAEILLIMHHEQLHVIATKAFSRVIRGRI